MVICEWLLPSSYICPKILVKSTLQIYFYFFRVGQNELIGCVGIGPSFSGIGRDHWYRMIENQRKPMTQSYFLRDASFLREGLPAKIEKALNSERQESVDSAQS